MRKAVVLLYSALLALTFLVGGCNTMSGLGQDIQSAGETIEKSAED